MDEFALSTLSDGAAAIGVRLDPGALERFSIYHREILTWNRRINLVSERSAERIVVRHFIDSLTAIPLLARPAGTMIDLGSGGGFPGIPLGIALPGLRLSLVEASRKKSSFLSHVVRTLRLEGVSVIRARLEELVSEQQRSGTFDALVSRAAFKLPELVRAAAFFLRPGGQMIAMKGVDLQSEMADAERIAPALGMVLSAIRPVPPQEDESQRNIVIYDRHSR